MSVKRWKCDCTGVPPTMDVIDVVPAADYSALERECEGLRAGDKPLQMALQLATHNRERAESAESKLAQAVALLREVVDMEDHHYGCTAGLLDNIDAFLEGVGHD